MVHNSYTEQLGKFLQKINNAKRLYAQARNEIAEVFNKLEIPITPEAERQP